MLIKTAIWRTIDTVFRKWKFFDFEKTPRARYNFEEYDNYLKVSTLTFEEFLNSRLEWDAALQKSRDNHIFLTWEWLSNWWKYYGDKRKFLMVTVNDGRKILAAAPLMSSRYKFYGLELRKIEFIATPVSDYHSFLLTEKKTEYVKTMLEYAAHIEPGWDCIELREIPDDSETARILRNISKKPFKFEKRIQNLCPYVFLSSNFEDYLQRLSSSFRYNLRRYERKLRKDCKVEFRICNDRDSVDNAMKTFFNLHQKRWQSQKQSGLFADRTFHDFHLDVARVFAKRGWLALNFLILNDEPIAVIYGFKYAQKLFAYLSGFDPRYLKYSIGHLHQMYIIKYCIENGLRECDLMRGDEPYKMKWNTSIRKNLEVRAIKKRVIPIAYNWITKNKIFSSLTCKLGKHLSVI